MSYAAIVSGASGKIGSHFIDQLNVNQIRTLLVSRKSDTNIKGLTNININAINKNDDLISNWVNNNKEKDIYFFHFAWSGDENLTDGNIASQLKNIELLSKAISIAKNAGCSKFINIGTTEELIVKENLQSWQNKPNSLKPYGLSKLTSFYYAQILTYLNKLDLIHIRFSAAVNSLSSKNEDKGFIHRNMRKIKNGESIDEISNNQLFDFIETSQLATLILETAIIGSNKEEYYLGPNYPLKLSDFFKLIKNEISSEKSENINCEYQKYYDNKKYVSKTGKNIKFQIKDFI